MKKKTDSKERMTLEDYQKKYSKPYNKKRIRGILIIAICVVAIFLIYCLFSLVLKIYEATNKNIVSLYISIPAAVLFFIVCFIVPLIKLSKLEAFETQNVSSKNIKEVQRHNKKIREQLADSIIDLQAKDVDVNWYNEETVGKLAIARHSHDDKLLIDNLNKIYSCDIKKSSRNMIFKSALQIGVATALSQNEKVDTLFSITTNIALIKKITFLYGFRPNDRQMTNIIRNVLLSSLVAYGSQNITSAIGNAVGQKIASSTKTVPVIGGVISTVVDSISQGIINASLTIIIGTQTKHYLKKEYNLQNILNDVVFEEDDVEEMIGQIKGDLVSAVKNKKQNANI